MTTNTAPNTATNSSTSLSVDLDRLAVDLDGNDFPAVSDRVAEVVRRAHLAGLATASLDVLSDDHAPDVVRARAVAVVIAQLRRARTADQFATVA